MYGGYQENHNPLHRVLASHVISEWSENATLRLYKLFECWSAGFGNSSIGEEKEDSFEL